MASALASRPLPTRAVLRPAAGKARLHARLAAGAPPRLGSAGAISSVRTRRTLHVARAEVGEGEGKPTKPTPEEVCMEFMQEKWDVGGLTPDEDPEDPIREADDKVIKESIKDLAALQAAEEEVLGKAWDILKGMGIKQPEVKLEDIPTLEDLKEADDAWLEEQLKRKTAGDGAGDSE